MSQSYINSINVENLLRQGAGTSYDAVTGVSYLDFSDTSTKDLSENYFNISPKLTTAVYNNLISKLGVCAKITTPITNYETVLAGEVNTGEYNYYKYSNSVYSGKAETNSYKDVDNKYLLKFEDIVCKNANNYNVSPDKETDIYAFIKAVSDNNNEFSDISAFNGGFFFVDLDTISQVTTDEGNYLIKAGESVEIPVTFEYFIDTASFNKDSIKKTIVFAIKDSLYENEKYYEVELTGNMSQLGVNSINTSTGNTIHSEEIDSDLL